LKQVIGIVIAYWLGYLPYLPISAGAFEVAMPGEFIQ
jgi:hypothetical protein